MSLAPFGWHLQAPVFVTAEGTLALAYDSADQSPRWSTDLGVPVVALASGASHAYALTTDGMLHVLALHDGNARAMQATPGAHGLVTTPQGTPALITDTGVIVDAVTLVAEKAAGVAFHSSEPRALVSTSNGWLHLFDTRTGQLLRSLQIGDSASGAVFSTHGQCWLVSSGRAVRKVTIDVISHEIFASFDGVFEDLCIDHTGRLVGARAGVTVLVIGFPHREVCASLRYMDKTPGQLAFGPQPWFGVGLNAGDANTVNMLQEGVCRSDPHEGRPRNRWMLSVSVKPDLTRKVMSQPSSPATAAAPVTPAQPQVNQPAKAIGGTKLSTGAIVAIIVGVLFALFCCCLGGLFVIGATAPNPP